MKCPYCNEDLKEWEGRFYCANALCPAKQEDLPKFIWQDLIDGICSTVRKMNKKFIVIIFRDNIPEYTVGKIFTDEQEAQKAGEKTLQEVLEDENKDASTYTMKVIDLSK